MINLKNILLNIGFCVWEITLGIVLFGGAAFLVAGSLVWSMNTFAGTVFGFGFLKLLTVFMGWVGGALGLLGAAHDISKRSEE